MKKFLSIKYIPYFFYILSILGMFLGVFFPNRIPIYWVVMVPFIMGMYIQSSVNKKQPVKNKLFKIILPIAIVFIITSAIVAMSLLLRQ